MCCAWNPVNRGTLGEIRRQWWADQTGGEQSGKSKGTRDVWMEKAVDCFVGHCQDFEMNSLSDK